MTTAVTSTSIRRPLGSISNTATTNTVVNAAGKQKYSGSSNVQKPQQVMPRSHPVSCSGSISVNQYSSQSHQKQQYDDDVVEIQEIRKSRERDEVTGMPKHTTLHRYFRGKMLGKGGFAKVYLATTAESQKDYAIKIVPKANLVKSRARAKLQAEIRIHRSLKHQNICEFKHFFEDGVNCYIMLELCHNQSMNELLKRRKRLTEPEVLYFMKQVVQGTQYMHSINVIHRDLKLGNLFLDGNMCVKIGDLGLAAKLEHADERRKTICGTPNYIAPEIIDGKNKEVGHTYHVDLWSTGVIMFALLCGKPPFESKDVKSTYKRILDIDYSYPKQISISPDSKDVIDALLQRIPEERLSLCSMLNHPALDSEKTFIPQRLSSDCLHNQPSWENENKMEQTDDSLKVTLPNFSSKRVQNTIANQASSSDMRQALSSHILNVNQNVRTLSSKSVTKQSKSSVNRKLQYNGESSNVTKPPRRPSSSAAFEIFGDDTREVEERRDNAEQEFRDEVSDTRRYSSSRESRLGSYHSYSRQSSSTLVRSSSAGVCELTARTSVMTLGEKRDDTESSETYQLTKRNSAHSASFNPLQNYRSSFASSLNCSDNNELTKDNTSKHSVIPQPLVTETLREVNTESYSAHQRVIKDIDIDVLESMHTRLVRAEKIQAGENIRIMSPQPKSIEGATRWVSRYVDYTSKYGLGFLLNDGITGVCFNDSTKAVLSPISDTFNYIERRKSKQVDVIPEEHTLSNYPDSLEKKVLLLKHFRNYLMDQEKRAGNKSESPSSGNNVHLLNGMEIGGIHNDNEGDEDLIYVKKWVRTRHAILFRLSDRTVQVVFFDHTELILSAGARLITYVDKHGDRTTFSLNNIAAEANSEISKRLRYAKDIMHQLITGQTQDVTC